MTEIIKIEDVTRFLGRPLSYWYELHNQAQRLNYDSLVTEIARLRYRLREIENLARAAGNITGTGTEVGP